jgi:anti-sigma factor RsiW
MQSKLQPVSPEELMAYLDGELPPEQAAAVASHLEECRECQILAAEIRSVSEGLTMWEVETVSSSIGSGVAQALNEWERTAPNQASDSLWSRVTATRFRFVTWAGGAVAASLVVLLVALSMVTTYRRSPEPMGSPVQSNSHQQPAYPLRQTLQVAPSAGPPRRGPGAGDRDTATEALNQRQPVELATRQFAPAEATKLDTVPATAPMILRTAQLTVVTQNLDVARTEMDRIVHKYSGYLGDLSASATTDGPRRLTATLRVPASQLDAALADLKTLGKVESESQSGQDVTAQYVDLEARLGNSRNTEQRLVELLRQRTGKLSDVLEVETEISRVREEIERMEGERRLLAKQVEYATLTATVTEEFKAPARALPESLGTRLRNAAIDGYESAVNFVIDVVSFLASNGPMLLVWSAILFFPARWAWRKARSQRLPPPSL